MNDHRTSPRSPREIDTSGGIRPCFYKTTPGRARGITRNYLIPARCVGILTYFLNNSAMADSIFTRIIKGEIPSYKVAEDDKHYAFLDINPIVKGHTLVVPKREVNYIFDLNDDEVSELFVFAKKVAESLKDIIDCKRVAIMVLGLEVPHAHIHLLPINSEGDIDLKKRVKLEPAELASIANRLLLQM